MLFNSLQFLIYFPVVVLIYFLIPFKFRWIWLLIASYFFYMSWNPKYAILMGISTLITYLSGILIEKSNQLTNLKKAKKQKKLWVTLSFTINLFILFFFKYFNFISENIQYILSKLNIYLTLSKFNILLPVGISFYTFQALSYTMDVYRGDIKAQKNLGKYALFVSFFPQLVAGPIERSTNLLNQLEKSYNFDYERVRNGLLLILWGLIKKVVIADRLSILVDTVYNNPTNYQGLSLIIATVFFAFQIYCDFSSYSDIAIGSANVMGYNLMKNFDKPYLATSVAEFWRKWHISLGTWFRDYLYFPMGGNRTTKLKKYRNIMTVFLVSGLWHGANWNFIIWGFLHGIYQIIGIVSLPLRNRFVEIFKLNRDSYGHKLYKIITTFILVDIAWIFFRANSLEDAFYILKNIFIINSFKIEEIGLNEIEFKFSIYLILILILIQIYQKNNCLRRIITRENLWIRWLIYYCSLMILIIFGKYGGINSTSFIYFQF